MENFIFITDNNPDSEAYHRKKRTRKSYTTQQLNELEKEFVANKYLTKFRQYQLTNHLNINSQQLKMWFQNRRMKEKKQILKVQTHLLNNFALCTPQFSDGTSTVTVSKQEPPSTQINNYRGQFQLEFTNVAVRDANSNIMENPKESLLQLPYQQLLYEQLPYQHYPHQQQPHTQPLYQWPQCPCPQCQWPQGQQQHQHQQYQRQPRQPSQLQHVQQQFENQRTQCAQGPQQRHIIHQNMNIHPNCNV